ncbi:C45 family peptidase [Stappia sp.]|uniref:C45 family peptidase n=1 Tax=Stappia sp. TaxID=1870903 RepID=UPI0032D93DAC
MNTPDLPRGTPLSLTGPPRARGAGQAAQAARSGVTRAAVAEATLARVSQARADGLIDAEAERYLAAQRDFAETQDPASMEELRGIAEGFGLDLDDLFAHLHLGILRDLAQGARADEDGCSALALVGDDAGPLVAKNRDFAGTHLGVQSVARHEGPDIDTGALLCVGSLGAPGAYSSGMNAAGLVLVDTQVGVRRHRVGWLRYFLMTRILATCRTVDDAVRLVRARPHAGGGTLVLADAQGASAAIELGAETVAVERAAPVWRTNHFVSRELAGDTLPARDDRVAENSRRRFAALEAQLPGTPPTAAALMRLMAQHADETPHAGPLCQHPAGDDARTISSTVYCVADHRLYFHEGNPCRGDWTHFTL